MNLHRIPCRIALLSIGCTAVLASFAAAQPLRRESALSALTKQEARLSPREALQPLTEVRSSAATGLKDAWAAFVMVNGDWNSQIDVRNGRLESAEGTGIPWLPGRGNRLQKEDIADLLGAKSEPDLSTLEALARKFVASHRALFGVADKDLRLNADRSGKIADHLWTVDFDVVLAGLPVEGARLLFRVGHGNLIQIGSEFLPSAGAVVPPVRISKDKAFAALSAHLGGLAPLPDELVDPGSLHLLPTAENDSRFPEGFAYGKGYGLLTVWQFVFRDEAQRTWRARVDATTGELVEFVNIDVDARATGGVAGDIAAGTETVRAMPFTDIGGGLYTDISGRYTYNGSTRTSTLNGLYARSTDSCGTISLNSDANGNLLFGSAAGNNCTTPGVGGAGNTRSSRTSFYYVNRGKDIARGWLPGNAWVNAQLTANVNLTGTCNGFWNGSTLQLYQAITGSCGASGEEPGFILHEYGHGLDANDGTGFNGQTSESYADVTAAISLHNSCIAPGFRTGNCGAYGDSCTACTGLRDIDWARHTSGVAHTVANYTQPFCSFGSGGPCGGEVHCESHISSEAIWDFANRDLPSPGTNAAWNVLERLWYLSRTTATNGFSCNTAVNPYTSNGCNAGSWWKTMRAIDDDDGNLANGTPHSCNLYAAFNRHGIACTTDTGANTCFRGCMPSGAPSVSYTGGYNSVAVNVSGTGVFDIYRNEIGCNAGFAKIANDVGSGTFTDTGVANGTTYYYQAVAQPVGNEACASAPSTCTTVALSASSYEGYHDNADCRSIFGWAWDQNRPNTPIDVDLYKDGVKVQNLQANLFRQDIFNAGKGNGFHAFAYTPDASYFDGVSHSMQVRFGGMATSLGTTPKSIICGVTIFTSQTPATVLDTAGQVYTVATQFSSSSAGYITHLRFRKAAGETGTNTGILWTNSGTQLASVNLTSCDANNWCSGTLSPAVAITASTLYRVSVNTNVKQSKTDCGLGMGITNGPLTAWTSYWSAGTGFPTTNSCSNYFVDVKFDL